VVCYGHQIDFGMFFNQPSGENTFSKNILPQISVSHLGFSMLFSVSGIISKDFNLDQSPMIHSNYYGSSSVIDLQKSFT